jgi:hypothetical protein
MAGSLPQIVMKPELRSGSAGEPEAEVKGERVRRSSATFPDSLYPVPWQSPAEPVGRPGAGLPAGEYPVPAQLCPEYENGKATTLRPGRSA